MVRKRPQHVQNVPSIPLLSLLIYHHKNEHLGVYMYFFNFHIFLVTIPISIKLILVMNIQGYGETEAEKGINLTISEFIARKISIEVIVGDNKFEAVQK